MPTLAVARNFLFGVLGKTFSEEQFTDLCFQFGVELDDVTSQKEMFIKEHGAKAETKKLELLSDDVIYKIDTPANRYDLLSCEGMSVALKVFLGFMITPRYAALNKMRPRYRMTVDRTVAGVRDFVVCAVLKDVKFSGESYNSFIDFQEKLHSGLARRRTLASVGTHDLDKVAHSGIPPDGFGFSYSCDPKEDISFVPLNQTSVLHCAIDGLEKYFHDDRHISKYVPLISNLPKYPVVRDSSQKILSLPPIINSEHSKISVDTNNIFIECTAPDHNKASVLVNQIVCAFSSYCKDPFTVESVEVVYPVSTTLPRGGSIEVTPDLTPRRFTLDVVQVNKKVGINISAEECAALLRKMCLYAEATSPTEIQVDVPPTRSDILHECDLIEDVAIGFGYDNIVMTETPTHSYGFQQPINKLSDLLRQELASAGYTELLTFSLCSRDEAFKSLRRQDSDVAVCIANPQTVEFQVCRPSLLPGMLKALKENKSHPLPLKLFEVSDVVRLGDATGSTYFKTGAKNQRHLCALQCSAESNAFEDVHGLVEFLMMKLGIPQHSMDGFFLQEGSDAAFFPGRCMDVMIASSGTSRCIGHLGVLHPAVLKTFEVPFPCAYVELDIQIFAQLDVN